MKNLSNYWKAGIALVGTAGTAVATLAADENVRTAVGESGVTWLAVAGVALTTALTWLKRNEPTVTEAEEILRRAKERASSSPSA
ncbi:gp37 [Mycobacterium phage PLot]|uniref:Holin n=8 Tax=Plotvirus TaxID=2169613 RepID=Q19YB2_9CAUD|nr:gp36 [Mycobacterium phage PBI1]YP_655416.1 gp37 [Mycobacterium phage PLot]ACD49622.1 hypothetical protein Adjutor_37 [Mycobacterium phage Adjutor]ACI06324.1 hypothetical protein BUTTERSCOTCH_36 [Mycobacterium phage Butterscotch]AER49789.1 hypothetical protein NOVA_36 [Mycobacterium phage Nova]AWY03480.1 hypothetical protein ERK16_36 [Mycobacterium phage Erk16]QBI97101.1 hypothetical protein SEA_CHILL_37 [Mycobacterium phage Chill]QBP30034.1 hypothetical protein SEA_WALDOWHY_37 [Mycobacter